MRDYRRILVVDDDADVRDSLRTLLEAAQYLVRTFTSAKHFLAEGDYDGGCLISDVRMPEMDGLELQEKIATLGIELPVILITGHGDVPLAVRAMKAGAVDFIEKPFDAEHLLSSLQRALELGRQARDRAAEVKAAEDRLAQLTARERSVLDYLVQGLPNKIVAHQLAISPRTVELHRARIMQKMSARSLSDLVRDVLRTAEGRSG